MLSNLLLRRTPAPADTSRYTMQDYVDTIVAFNGHTYSVGGTPSLESACGNTIVAACIHARLLVFTEARFQFQAMKSGRPAAMFGTPALSVLERPWASASTGDLLARMELDASMHGNSFWVRGGDGLVRLDPAKVTVASGDVVDTMTGKAYGKRLLGYVVKDYPGSRDELAFFEPSEIAHYRPIPSAVEFVGGSWLSACLPEVKVDTKITQYKTGFLDNAATPAMVVSYDATVSPEQFEMTVKKIREGHEGSSNAFKTLHLAGGADAKIVGADFAQLAMKATQGTSESRIAAAAGVPASYVGISEGLAGSSLNSGNYGAARRRFGDGTIRPLWRAAASALETLVPPPAGSRLYYDDRDVSFLQEDVMDSAEIRARDASTIGALIIAGFEPSSAVDAVNAGDMTLLVHTGLVSVQLTAPGSTPQGGTP